MMRKISAVLTFAAGSLLGCGSVSQGDDPGVPLFTVQGGAQGEWVGGSPPSHPRVALTWFAFGSSVVQTTQPIEAKFPVSFSFDLYSAPPSNGYAPSNIGLGKYALATLLAFDDVNSNGKLDVARDPSTQVDNLSPGASVAPDVLIGHSVRDFVLYVDSVPSDFDGKGIFNPASYTRGWHVARACYLASGGDENPYLQILPEDARIDVKLETPSSNVQFDLGEIFRSPQTLPACGT